MSEVLDAKEYLKRKIEATPAQETVVVGLDETEYKVKAFIPYNEMYQAALERTAIVATENEEEGVFIRSYLEELANTYIFCKFYTDIPVPPIEDGGLELVFDYVRKARIDGSNWLWRHADWAYLVRISDIMITTLEDAFKKKHEPMGRLGELIQSLPTDQDGWMKELAQSQEVNEKMIELIGLKEAKDEAEAKTNNLIDFARIER